MVDAAIGSVLLLTAVCVLAGKAYAATINKTNKTRNLTVPDIFTLNLFSNSVAVKRIAIIAAKRKSSTAK